MALNSQGSVENELRLAQEAYRAGDLNSAAARVDRLLSEFPGRADVLLSKGVIKIVQGSFAEGLEWLVSTLQKEPDNPEALGWAAFAGLNLRRNAEAEEFARRLTQVDPQNARAYYLLANALHALGQIEEALHSIDRAIELQPEDTDSLVTKARLLRSWNLPALATEFYRRALAIRPAPAAAIDLAQILLHESQPEEALELLESVVPILPDSLRPYDLIAQAQTEMQLFDEADLSWAVAEKFSRDRTALTQRRAKAEIAVGRFDAAETLLANVMGEEPGSGYSYYLLSTARKMREDDLPLAERMQGLLAKGNLSPHQAAELNYALGKTFDDLKDYERAIAHFDEANRIGFEMYSARAQSPFRVEDARAYTDAQIAYFTKDRVRELQESGLPSDLPLFVVGMARSGTTLTSQILCAHSKVGGGNEYSFWTERAIEFLQWNSSAINLKTELVAQFAHDYLDLLKPKTPEVLHMVDKNPMNFQHAPMLHGLFPNARFIHLLRHPVDNVLSIWMTPLGDDGSFVSKRENLVCAMQEHLKLLRHFREVIPEDRFATIRYEDLTSNPGNTIPAMLRFVGLEPEPACLEPEKNVRAVHTPSVRQVRQPIHRGSQERWKNYEPWLGEFAELLRESETN